MPEFHVDLSVPPETTLKAAKKLMESSDSAEIRTICEQLLLLNARAVEAAPRVLWLMNQYQGLLEENKRLRAGQN